MRKSEIIATLEKIHGDPEIKIRLVRKTIGYGGDTYQAWGELERINEYPAPEIVVIEK